MVTFIDVVLADDHAIVVLLLEQELDALALHFFLGFDGIVQIEANYMADTTV